VTDPEILAANLRVLAGTDPELAERVRRAPAPEDLDSVLSRSGLAVPRLRRGERRLALHSTVDPVREAERATASADGAYIICFGLGGGYHLPFLLSRPATERLLVIETGPSMLRGLLALRDLRAELSHPSIRLVSEPDAAGLADVLLGEYLPAVYRTLRTFPLRARVDADPAYYGAARAAVERAIDAAARDHSVQTRFGWRWLRNTLGNLRAVSGAGAPPAAALPAEAPAPRVLVTGAGPSLEAQLPRLRALRKGSYLLATDASVAPLVHAGVVPDAVLSVDCQHIMYHHFLAGLPADCLLVLDLGSPPLLGRLTLRRAFVSTSHPLARYLVRRGLEAPYIDASGGNVSHAAVSLAASLGAEEIVLFGVDLSYPCAKPYARGCFLYPALDGSTTRLRPLEGAVSTFAYGSPSTRRVAAPAGAAYITETMASYRAHLERLTAETPARVIQEPGMGPPLALGGPRGRHAPRRTSDAGAAAVAELLAGYARELASVPLPTAPFPAYLRGLDAGRREALATLLPVVAARQPRLGYPAFAESFADARDAVLAAVADVAGRNSLYDVSF
jgi:hypothetical protein